MKVKKFEIKIHNAKSGIPIVQIDASIFSPPPLKKKGKRKKNRKYRTFESLRVILHIETERGKKRERERENEPILCRSWKIHLAGRFSWAALHSFTRIVRKTGLQRDRYCLQRHP